MLRALAIEIQLNRGMDVGAEAGVEAAGAVVRELHYRRKRLLFTVSTDNASPFQSLCA